MPPPADSAWTTGYTEAGNHSDLSFRLARPSTQSLVFRFPQPRFRRARAFVLVGTMSRSSVVTVQKEKRSFTLETRNAARRIRSFGKANTAEQVLKAGVSANRIKDWEDLEELQRI
jgi:hypothetical protein